MAVAAGSVEKELHSLRMSYRQESEAAQEQAERVKAEELAALQAR